MSWHKRSLREAESPESESLPLRKKKSKSVRKSNQTSSSASAPFRYPAGPDVGIASTLKFVPPAINSIPDITSQSTSITVHETRSLRASTLAVRSTSSSTKPKKKKKKAASNTIVVSEPESSTPAIVEDVSVQQHNRIRDLDCNWRNLKVQSNEIKETVKPLVEKVQLLELLFRPYFGPTADLLPNINTGMVIVIDSNIVLNHLRKLKRIRELPVNGEEPPKIYIPYVLLTELNSIKDNTRLKLKSTSKHRWV